MLMEGTITPTGSRNARGPPEGTTAGACTELAASLAPPSPGFHDLPGGAAPPGAHHSPAEGQASPGLDKTPPGAVLENNLQ